jgi:hypothetical protein
MTEIFQFSNPQDKFGFYQSGNFKTYSKLEAIEAETKTGHAVKWNFNDRVFSQYNWAAEPPESLNELYCRRAQQIRDEYDYIILVYSSGADSDNILTTFINNNIKLDELVMLTNETGTKDKNHWFNKEIYEVAVVRAEEAKTKQPDLKSRIIDIVPLTLEYFSTVQPGLDYIYTTNGYISPGHIGKNKIRESVPEWQRMINAGKKVVLVWGTDKPVVQGIDGSYYFMCRDMAGNAVSAAQQMENMPGIFDEFFYWSPECVPLLIKQGHTIKNYLKLITEANEFVTTQPAETPKFRRYLRAGKFENNQVYSMTNNGLHTLIYPNWRDNIYTYKSGVEVLSVRDEWLYTMPDAFDLKRLVKTGFQGIRQHLPVQWTYNQPFTKNLFIGIKPCYSMMHCLGS